MKMNVWQELKQYTKCTWQDWYIVISAGVMMIYWDVCHVVDVAWKWIRDYILGGIAVVTVLLFLGIKNLIGYYATCLARRMGIMAEVDDAE